MQRTLIRIEQRHRLRGQRAALFPAEAAAAGRDGEPAGAASGKRPRRTMRMRPRLVARRPARP